MPFSHQVNFWLAVGWIAFFVLGSFVYRRLNEKYIFRPKFENTVYKESRASGRSLRTFYSRIGGASNCLWITVADNVLHVGPHFPFNLMFMPEFYGLEYSIPAEKLLSIERRERFRKPYIRITFRREVSDEESFEIYSKRPDELLAVLESMRAKGTR